MQEESRKLAELYICIGNGNVENKERGKQWPEKYRRGHSTHNLRVERPRDTHVLTLSTSLDMLPIVIFLPQRTLYQNVPIVNRTNDDVSQGWEVGLGRIYYSTYVLPYRSLYQVEYRQVGTVHNTGMTMLRVQSTRSPVGLH